MERQTSLIISLQTADGAEMVAHARCAYMLPGLQRQQSRSAITVRESPPRKHRCI